MTKVMPPVRLGIIGAGDMACTHMRDMVNLGNMYDVRAICDVVPARLEYFKTTFHSGADWYDDYRKLLEREDLDAVIIASRNDQHREHAVAAYDARKHVLLQKPMGISLQDCDDIIEAAKKARKTLQVGLVYRYSPIFRMMKKLIDAGRIGKPLMAYCHEFRVPFPIGNGREWRYDQALSGGSLVEKDCHHFDLFNWMFDALPVRVQAMGGCAAVREGGAIQPGVPGEPHRFAHGTRNNIIDHALVNIEFDNNCCANLALALFSGNRDLPFCVLGDGGWIEANVQKKLLMLHSNEPGRVEYIEPEKAAHELADKGHSGGARELFEFAGCVHSGAEPACGGAAGRASLLAALAGEKSIRERRTVMVSELA